MPQQSIDFKSLFNSLPAGYIAFDVNDPLFTIVAQNDRHADMSMTKGSGVIGKPLLEAFPDVSEKYVSTGVSDLLESIRKVIKTGKVDTMPLLNYDLKDKKGNWEKRYWRVDHHPVKDAKGNVIVVYQSTNDITEEITTGERLQHIEEQFHLAAENGLISVWRWDIKAEKVYADANLSKLFGISPKKGAEGLPINIFIDSIHEDDRERVQSDIATALSTRKPYEAEYRTITKDGIKYVIARGVVETNDKGEPVSFPGIIVDITERKNVEIELSESENRLRFMADSMPQLVWITRPDGFHEYYNQRWYDYTGTKPGSADGEGWNDLFHPYDQAEARKRWRHSLKTGEPYEIEYRLYHASSESYRWVIGRAMPFRDANGTILKWYGTCTDIQDQKMAENNLRFLSEATSVLASSLDYKKTLKQISRLVVPELADWCTIDMFDEAGVLQLVALAHKDREKATWARDLRAIQGPPDLSAPTGLPNVLRTGEPEFYSHISDEMLVAGAKNKEELKLLRELGLSSVIIVPIIVDKKVTGAITLISAEQQRHYTEVDLGMASELSTRASIAIKNSYLYTDAQREIAERARLEKELKAANERLESRVKERTLELEKTNLNLEQSNRELEDFAYVASHDLQEPLRKIQAFGDLLDEEYASQLGEGRDYLQRMQGAASRMSSLINDLLTFSRVSTKKAPLAKISLDKVISGVMSDLEDRVSTTHGTIKVDPLPELLADPLQMRQLFQNLLANALKFHKDDTPPVIQVTSKEMKDEKGKVIADRIEVKDNGVGFDVKYLDRIFSVFQRLHGRDKFEGTGIGLAVCRKIVERHGGTISANSKPGEGAVFIITLPRNRKKGEAA